MKEKSYICIDIKSFYASIECIERGLDPMDVNLIVADPERTEKTICLAVSPALKTYGIPGRARLFEVIQKVDSINIERKKTLGITEFDGCSYFNSDLKSNHKLALSYIVAAPRMALYMKCSTDIYKIYLKYVAHEDIHVYSIDEVFIDATRYLKTNNMTASEFASLIINDIFDTIGVTATAGIGTNLYLAKIAMDIVAKHMEPDKNGVRMAVLDEMEYRRLLWEHIPLTDFWRIGKGYEKKLALHGIYTMGDIAKCSVGKDTDYYNEELLYKLFGINAELLIDHAWGYEPCTIAEIKSYRADDNSKSEGQVLQCAYDFNSARLVVHEMIDNLSLELFDMGYVTNQIVLTVGYDIECFTNVNIRVKYKGEMTTDRYGRKIPKNAHGTENLEQYTSSSRLMSEAALRLFDRIVNKDLLVRRIYVVACHILPEKDVPKERKAEQLDFFTDYDKLDDEMEKEKQKLQKERKIQRAILDIKKQYGKNAIIKGINLEDGATQTERNNKIGGHKA